MRPVSVVLPGLVLLGPRLVLLGPGLVLLGACSSLLGIEDPKPRSDGGADAADDAANDSAIDTQPGTDHLAFSLGDIRIAQNQAVHLRVLHVHMDGTSEDVTATADYGTSDDAVASIDPGAIRAHTQQGTATITATLTPAAPATMTVSVTSFVCHPVINELATGSAASAIDEWVEIYNPCTTTQDVNTWSLVYRAASNVGTVDTNLMATLAGQMAPGEYRLYAGSGFTGTADGPKWTMPSSGILQQTNGAVGLRAGTISTGALVDAVAYGTVSAGHPFIETNPAPAMSNDRSAGRLPFDGKDDGDATHDGDGAADFLITQTPTPRAPNAP
ncbi:MAG TPA: lamin tail domain-containing protein [Kofleriaceae bacterium]|nr:lamin tail domain-containing protein [Kofleriaceae bacterium]